MQYSVAALGRSASFGTAPGGPSSAQSVTAFGFTFVAVGSVGRASRGTAIGADAAVWYSTDGVRWQRVPANADLANAAMTAVLAVGHRLVAVGCAVPQVHLPAGFNGQCAGAAAWTSPDGVHWHRAPVPRPASRFESDSMLALAAGPKGLLAAGFQCRNVVGCQGGGYAIWTSADGRAWTMEHLHSAVFTLPYTTECGGDLSLAWSAGGVYSVADACGGAIWTSADGASWSALTLPFTPGAIARTPVGLVAMDNSAQLWGSRDGRTWQGPAAPNSPEFASIFSGRGFLDGSSSLIPMSDAPGTRLVAVTSGPGNAVSGLALLDVQPGFTGASVTPVDPAPPHPEASLTGVAVIGRTVVAATGGSFDQGGLWSVTLP